MANRFSKEATGVLDGTNQPGMANGAVLGGVERLRASYNLATDGAVLQADNILLGELPIGSAFIAGILTNSVTMGAAAAIAIGTSKVHANNGQFRAAAVATTAEAPALFGRTAAQIAAPSTVKTPVYLTVGGADLPAAGIIDVEILYSTRN